MIDIGYEAPIGSLTGGGLVLLDRREYGSSATWSKPADGAGNLLAGIGKLVIARGQGGGGGGRSPGSTRTSGGNTTFGSYFPTPASGGLPGETSNPGQGGEGSLRRGQCGVHPVLNGSLWFASKGGGDGGGLGRDLGNTNYYGLRGGGGAGANGSQPYCGGGEGGESLTIKKIGDVTATVTFTIGAGGDGDDNVSYNAGGPGWGWVETWGVLS